MENSMARESRISDWIQIAASLSVLVGLILVAIEIRESNRVATSESVGAISQSWIDISLVGAESDLSRILAKSYEDPYNLSTEEMIRLSFWYESMMGSYDWWLRSSELGTSELNPAADFGANAEEYFGSPFGRAFLEYARTWARPELIEAADAALANKPPNQIQPSIALMRDFMRQQEQESTKE
jgi:hypothetical protein